MKKAILFSIVSFTIFACVPKNNTTTNIENTASENESIHNFKTQATITEAQLVADLNELRKKNNSFLLVSRVVFYKNNYPALFALAMTHNPELQKALKWNTGIMNMMKKDVPFANFVNNVSPSPSPSFSPPIPCPSGFTGMQPACVPIPTITPSSCPPGFMGMPPACMPMTCPSGMGGIPPACTPL